MFTKATQELRSRAQKGDRVVWGARQTWVQDLTQASILLSGFRWFFTFLFSHFLSKVGMQISGGAPTQRVWVMELSGGAPA